MIPKVISVINADMFNNFKPSLLFSHTASLNFFCFALFKQFSVDHCRSMQRQLQLVALYQRRRQVYFSALQTKLAGLALW